MLVAGAGEMGSVVGGVSWMCILVHILIMHHTHSTNKVTIFSLFFSLSLVTLHIRTGEQVCLLERGKMIFQVLQFLCEERREKVQICLIHVGVAFSENIV